jgi:hypothetical protein
MAILHAVKTKNAPLVFAPMCALALAVSLFSLSCATSGGTRHRGNLSDAMEAARDDHKGDRTVNDDHRRDEPDRDYIARQRRESEREREMERDQDLQNTGASPSLNVSDIRLGFRGGAALTNGSDIVTTFDGDLLLGIPLSKSLELDLFAGLKVAKAEEGSDLDASVRDSIVFLKAGVEGRYAPFPKRTIFSPYLMGGLGGYGMFWSFRNAVTSGSEVIESDSLGGLLLYAGLGADLVKTKRLRIGLNLIQDAYLFSAVTSQGFTNDVFSSYGTARLMGEITYKF